MSRDISIVTPQFDRGDDTAVSFEPDEAVFQALPYMSEETLLGLGLQRWSDDHFLFPHEWYEHIPEGYEVVSILDEVEEFSTDTHHDDRRFGVLSYGVVRADRSGWQNADDNCMLCQMEEKTHWYTENDFCVVADTLGRNPHPFVVSKRHGAEPTQLELEQMRETVENTFPDRDFTLDVRMGMVPNHFHAHVVFEDDSVDLSDE